MRLTTEGTDLHGKESTERPRASSAEICKTIPKSSSWLVFLYSLGGLRFLQKMPANRDLTTWLGLLAKVKWESVGISGQRSAVSGREPTNAVEGKHLTLTLALTLTLTLTLARPHPPPQAARLRFAGASRVARTSVGVARPAALQKGAEGLSAGERLTRGESLIKKKRLRFVHL